MASRHRTYWLTGPCRVRRKDQSLLIERNGQPPVHLPVTDVRDIVACGPIDVNTAVVSLLRRHGIVIHLLDHYGNYAGAVETPSSHASGLVVTFQVQAAASSAARLSIARALVQAAAHNANVVLSRPTSLSDAKQALDQALANASSNDQIMGAEGRFQRFVWPALDDMLPDWLRLRGRRRRPPPNPGNGLVSYVNGIVYGACVTALRMTALHTAVGFLHASMGRHRHTLALDLAEPFKPLVTLRLVRRLAARRQIKPDHFDVTVKQSILTDNGRKLVVTAARDLLESKVENPQAGRPTSITEMMYLDSLRLVRHLIDPRESYIPTKAWW